LNYIQDMSGTDINFGSVNNVNGIYFKLNKSENVMENVHRKPLNIRLRVFNRKEIMSKFHHPALGSIVDLP
jgi:hypothetical protein